MILFCGGIACFTHLPWSLKKENEQIEINGNHVVTQEQVIKALAGAKDKPIYCLDPRILESRIASLPVVRHAFVRRYALPKPKLKVEILEEYPWASFSRSPQLPPEAVIAQSGRFIPIAEFPRVARPALIIYGQPGMKISQKQVVQWASWAAFISKQTGRAVNSIDMRQPFSVWVNNEDLILKLGIPDTSLTRRLGRLVSVLPVVESVKEKLEYVDLGLDNSIPLKISKNVSRDKLKELEASRPAAQVAVDGAETTATQPSLSPTPLAAPQVVQGTPAPPAN
jgi:cell division septal protein FtsQ